MGGRYTERMTMTSDLAGERLLYVPNEMQLGGHVGPRRTFEHLLATGRIEAYEAVPLPLHVSERGPRAALDGLLAVAERLRPSLVLWQHPSSLDIPSDVFSRLQAAGAYLVYHEADAYGRVRKRLPIGARQLAAAADLTLTVGTGAQFAALRRGGARSIGYVPSSVDLSRFGGDWFPTPDRKFDVAFIGNRVAGRLPGIGAIPGARRRVELARGLGSLLGARLALYGDGWSGFIGARGRLPFDAQSEAAREAWLTVSLNHFDHIPHYFSNRLPIGLAAGVAHVTHTQPGYDELFVDGCELFLTGSVRATVERVESLLAGPRENLDDVGLNGQALARHRLADEVVYPRMLEVAVQRRDGCLAPPPPRVWLRGSR
jgi:hypothetical protein